MAHTLPGIPNHHFHARIGRLAHQPEAARNAARIGDGFGLGRHNIAPTGWTGDAPAPAAFPPRAPKYPGFVRLLVPVAPSLVLWGLIFVCGGYLGSCAAREAVYALAHPHGAAVAEAGR